MFILDYILMLLVLVGPPTEMNAGWRMTARRKELKSIALVSGRGSTGRTSYDDAVNRPTCKS